MREALAAQLLEECDQVLARVETLTGRLEAVETQHGAMANSLLEASDKYRLAVTSFTEHAKTDLSEHASRTVTRTRTEVQQLMMDSAQMAFHAQASDQARDLADELRDAAAEFNRSRFSRLTETAVVAFVVAAVVLGGAVYVLK